MIVQVAVSAATFAIDKPYSYRVPEGMPIQPGQRVQLPFGRGNRPTEGVVLTVSPGDDGKLKEVTALLDPEPILTTGSSGWRLFFGNGISAPFTTPFGPCCPGACGSGSG